MNLTDIIPPGTLGTLTHLNRDNNREARCQRVESAYGQDIIACLRICGCMTKDPEMEYRMMMYTIAVLDFAIEQATKGAPQ